MKSLQTFSGVGAIALLTIAAGCSNWNWDRTGQTSKDTTVGSASSTSPTRDTANSAGAKTSGQVALGSQSGSTNPPSTHPDSRSVAGGSPSYTRPASAVTADMNAGTTIASSGASTSSQNMASAQQSSATNTPYSPNMGAAGTSRTATRHATTSNQSTVRSAQQALNDQGYNAGTVDGIVGPRTQAAIREFQSDKGIQATGRLDSATIAALGVTQPSGSATTGMNSNAPERVSAAAATKSSSK